MFFAMIVLVSCCARAYCSWLRYAKCAKCIVVSKFFSFPTRRRGQIHKLRACGKNRKLVGEKIIRRIQKGQSLSSRAARCFAIAFRRCLRRRGEILTFVYLGSSLQKPLSILYRERASYHAAHMWRKGRLRISQSCRLETKGIFGQTGDASKDYLPFWDKKFYISSLFV